MLWQSVDMGKDFRIGLIVGLVLVVAALFWVATRPRFTPEARLLGSQPAPPAETVAQTPPEATLPSLTPVEPDAPPPTATLPGSDSTRSQVSPTDKPGLPDLTIYEQAEKIQTTKFHIVLKNENLSSISQKHYGTANQWQKILQANRDTIKDANKITPGTKLIIPD